VAKCLKGVILTTKTSRKVSQKLGWSANLMHRMLPFADLSRCSVFNSEDALKETSNSMLVSRPMPLCAWSGGVHRTIPFRIWVGAWIFGGKFLNLCPFGNSACKLWVEFGKS
jgi:hypothetical protein